MLARCLHPRGQFLCGCFSGYAAKPYEEDLGQGGPPAFPTAEQAGKREQQLG